jgi:hypothetical protein
MRRSALLALVTLVAVALAGQPAPPASAQDPYSEIQALLDRRAEAMLRGDRDAFLATVDRADIGFVERQGRLFDGFQQLGLAAYRLDVTTRYWPELTTDREDALYGEPVEPTVLHVEERYRIRVYDREPALEDLFLTFLRRGEEWKVASDTDLDEFTLYSGRKMWEIAPIVTRESEHFRYVSHPELADAADQILASAERALAVLDDKWPLSWSRKVLILAPSTSEETSRILQATFDLENFVAFAYSGVDRAEDWDLNGHRIILNWPNFSVHPEETQQRILVHELLHIATRELSGPSVTAFVDEGIAEWVSQDESVFEVAQAIDSGDWDRALPRDFEFITGDGEDISEAYQESYTAAQFAAERFGAAAVADWYRLVGEARLALGTPRYHVDRGMRAAFGLSYEAFEERWADYVEDAL